MSVDAGCILLTVVPLGLLGYSYLGFPGVLWVLERLFPRKRPPAPEPLSWPSVSLVVAAFNEAAVIVARVQNLLSIDYPRDQVEVLVGSDGSTDGTAALVRGLGDPRTKVTNFPRRRGKASVVNDLIAQARGDIVVLTDANTFFRPDAVRELVKALNAAPLACAVVGELELRATPGGSSVEGLYWRYETGLKRLESHFGSVLGANGAIYAFRRERYQPLPPNAVVDDFLIPMLMQLDAGGAVRFVPSARAYEMAPDSLQVEFRRRVRIGAGDFQALGWTWRLLSPRRGMLALTYFSHKVLRWFGPWLLLAALVGNLCLADYRAFRGLLFVQVGFYLLGVLARWLRPVPVLGRLAAGARYFLIVNLALLLGFFRFILGVQRPFWTTARE